MIIISLTVLDLETILINAHHEYRGDIHSYCVDIEIIAPTVIQGESDCIRAYLQGKDADFDSLPIFTNER